MGKIPVVIRSITLVCLAALVFAVGGMGMTDSNNPVLLTLTMTSMLYFVLEVCAIVYRFLRYRNIDDSKKQLKWVMYQQNHQLEFKVVAVLRRFALVGTIALLASIFVKNAGFGFLSNIKVAGLGLADIAKGYTQSSIALLLMLLVMTFVKSWYVMHTNWEGSYSTFTIFRKYISQDYTVPESIVEKVLYIAAILFAVVSVLAL